jgi:hypothetical protein
MAKAWLLLGFWTALIGGCGGDDEGGSAGTPEQACKSYVSVICKKIFGCFSDAELDAAAQFVGNNEADCRTKLEQDSCSEEMTRCDSGETYSSSKADECLDQTQALSCNEIMGVTAATPAACEQVCQ